MNTVHPQECTENIDRVKIAEITSIEFHSAGHENMCVNFFFFYYIKKCVNVIPLSATPLKKLIIKETEAWY